MCIVSFLEAWRGWREWWRCGASSSWCIKAILLGFWCGACNLDRRCAKSEGLWLDDLADGGVLDLVALAGFSSGVRVHIHWVAWRWAPAAGPWGEGTKSRCVGCGL